VFGYNLFAGSYLSLFFVKVFGIPSAAVSTMILVLGIWDTINDPLMGGIIDKTRTRYGKLRPYLLIVPIPLAIATILFWSGPIIMQNVGNMVLKIVYMYISYIIWEFFYTIGDVPFWGMSSAISPSPSDRTRAISTARFLSGIIGGLSSSFLLPVLMDLSSNGVISWSLKQVFAFLGFLAALFCVGLFSLAGLFTKERVVQSVQEDSIIEGFKYLFKNKPLLLMILGNVLGTVSSVATVFGSYYYNEVLNLMSMNVIVSLLGSIGGYLAYIILPIIKRKLDNRQIVFFTAITKAVIGTICFFIGMNNYDKWYIAVPILAVQNIVLMFVGTINQIVPTEMIGDTVDYMEWKTGVRNEGISFSVQTFVGKLTSSVSTSIATALLPVIGYIVTTNTLADGTTETISQCTSAGGHPTEFWLWTFFTIIPNVAGLISVIPYFFYDLRGEKLEKIRSEMKVRREQLSKEVSNGGEGNE
jgi:GPH family glycoside/pentoside/hexuronide:cation symporter/probable glucitol transport protein GutA